MKINNFNFECLFDKYTGTFYKDFSPHEGGIYDCVSSDEYDDENNEYINFKPCYLTRGEIKNILRQDIYH